MTHFQIKIKAIVSDWMHGSSVLLANIIESLNNSTLTRQELEWAFDQLSKIDPSMVIIHHFIKALRPKVRRNFFKHLHTYMRRWKQVGNRVAERLAKHLHHQKLWILTHSHSGLVTGTIKHLAEMGYELRVIQTESNPGREGVSQAQALRDLGLSVQLINDDHVWSYAMDVDVVLLGVDHFDDFSFVNKKGSNKIIEIANRFDIPVFVLGDSRKKVFNVAEELNPPFEKISMTGRNIALITEYYEPRKVEVY